MGVAIAVGATAYLLLALTVLIPHFRAGAEVHYASYFGDLGHSPGEIARSVLTRPGAVLGRVLSQRSLTYAVLLLLPYGLMPLRSPGRLLVALPLFGVLCLMDTSGDPARQGVEMLLPFHHFHAPLVPILVWAAAAGLHCVRNENEPHSRSRIRKNSDERAVDYSIEDRSPATLATPANSESTRPSFLHCDHNSAISRARIAAFCALATGLFYSLSPLGIGFWDDGSSFHWRRLYVPGERAAMLPRILEQIPMTARIASTDFVHPRFTHYERSYDYSQYRRSVSGFRSVVPDDTDYIVIDTRHPYSTIQSPEDVRELKEEPDRWELLPDTTDGYFIVLKARSATLP